MTEKIGLEAFLELAGFSKAAAKYEQIVGKMGDVMQGFGLSAETAGKITDNLIPIVGGMGIAAAGAGVAIDTLKKSFEFAKEGAAIMQTKESFDNLMASMNMAPDILNQMRAASLNTVDDLTLMSSTMTLVAGTSDKLGSAMVNAAPELLRIAKAANKLNPSLGDTAFLYNSLATGIKRSSPLILDNLGLTVKVSAANEAYAKSVGKTVEELSAEEKQMALLEAALDAGSRMMEQAGGSAKSMADDFLEAETRIKNIGNELKTKAVPIWAGFLDILNQTVKGFQILGAAISGEIPAVDYFTIGLEYQRIAMEEGVEAAENYANAAIAAGGAAEYQAQKFEKSTAAVAYQYERLINVTNPSEYYKELGNEIDKVTVDTKDLEKAQKALEDVFRDVRKAYMEFASTVASGITEYRNLSNEAQKSSKKYEQALRDLASEGAKSLKEVQDGFEASLPDATTVADRMGMAEDAWDEWGLRIQDIIENGVESPWYAALREMGYAKPPDVGIAGWAEDLKQQFYMGQLPDLLPPEWAENVRQQQEEATRVVQAENAKRRAEAEAARQEELAREREARAQMMFELSLNLAEASGKLEAWAAQKFGPDWSEVMGYAGQLKELIEAGIIDIDAALQGMLTDVAVGIGTTLDETAKAAETNASKIEELFSRDLEAEASRLMPIEEIKQQWFGGVGEMYTYLEEEAPETPFDPILDNWYNVSSDIMTRTTLMGLDLTNTFGEIDTKWAGAVQEMARSMDTGASDIQKDWRDKVIKTIEQETPRRIVVTVETEVEGS